MVIEHFGPYQWTKTSQAFYDVLMKFANKNNRLLELGSSSGHISFKLAKNGYKVTLLDIRPTPIIEAQLNFRKYGVDGLFFSEDFFLHQIEYDLIWSSGLIQCFNDNDKLKLLQHASKLSRRFLAFYPDTDSGIKKRGSNSSQIPGVGDAMEYSTENVPLLFSSIYSQIFCGRVSGLLIDMAFDMLWTYGQN